MKKINSNNIINFYGIKLKLLPFLTYPEKQMLIDKFKNTPKYCFKSGKSKCGINGWYLHFNNKVMSENELITLFKTTFPNLKLNYYK